MSGVFYMINVNFFLFLKDYKFLIFATIFLVINLIIFSQPTLSETENSKKSINGSGLKVPRMAILGTFKPLPFIDFFEFSVSESVGWEKIIKLITRKIVAKIRNL